MNCSLNEMELLAKRAARGAGYCWGLAEEAARATRWLCARDMDGGRQLALLLQRGFAANGYDHRPQQIDGIWQGNDILCPIMTGCLLSDCAARLRKHDIHTGALAAPALLLPFAASAARILGICVTISASGWRADADGTELSADDVLPEQADAIHIHAGGMAARPRRRQSRATPEPAGWKILNHLAGKTYAPATEESRLLGAGAGVFDSD